MLNAHHIEGRTRLSTRWDLNNGVALCPAHHTFGQISAHSQSRSGRREFDDWLIGYRGKTLEDLEKKAFRLVKYTIDDLETILEELNYEVEQEDGLEEITRNINS